ncbi:MAG TPA: DHH family phosphoesterase, partial [Spirochaetota bacterium]|nr:DHH family phosphoesterase [Spirochaetota bacterium]
MKIIKTPLDFAFIKKWTNAGLDPIALSILYRRNVFKEDDLLDFFSPVFENIIQPFEFTDIEAAYKRFAQALENKEKIIIFGDRDVDGTTSVSILYDFIKQNNDNVFWEVPVGLDVYGLDKKKFESWKAKGYTLCITVDCGITNVKEIEELKRLGIDAIIIDHHKPLEILPECAGIVNPKCEKKFEFNDIAACGVVFLFIYGYLIYKSAFFNKKIAVVFSNEGKIIVDIYKNFIFQGTAVLNDIEEVKRTDSDRVYFLTDKSDERGKLINNFHKKSFINILKDKRLFTRLILFNNLLKEIDGLEKIKESYLPFVTLGLIADVMPVIKTNRILISIGLSYIRDKKNYNLT